MTFFFFIETDSPGEMLLTIFHSFFIHAAVIKPQNVSDIVLDARVTNKLTALDFDQGAYNPSRETQGDVGNVLTCGGCYARCLEGNIRTHRCERPCPYGGSDGQKNGPQVFFDFLVSHF